MQTKNNNGLNDVENQHPKGNELMAVYEYLQTHIATSTMAAVALNIYRPNLCRRKRKLEKAGLLVEVKEGICKVTRCRAAFLTTNPAWFPISLQLNLFQL